PVIHGPVYNLDRASHAQQAAQEAVVANAVGGGVATDLTQPLRLIHAGMTGVVQQLGGQVAARPAPHIVVNPTVRIVRHAGAVLDGAAAGGEHGVQPVRVHPIVRIHDGVVLGCGGLQGDGPGVVGALVLG